MINHEEIARHRAEISEWSRGNLFRNIFFQAMTLLWESRDVR
jgi:hypothetical protein